MKRTLSLLGGRNLAFFCFGRWISFLGNAMAPVAVAFAVLDLTGSASALGLVLAARTAPQVVLLVVGGVWSDRLPRNVVLVGACLVSGAAQAVVAVLLIAGSAEVWQILALEAVNGAGFAFSGPADGGVVPLIVEKGRFQEANSLVRFGTNSATILGAALAGLLVAAFNPGWTVAVDAATFFVAAALFSGMRGLAAASAMAASFVHELREGWNEFLAHRWLWAIVVQWSVMLAAFLGGFMVLGPVVADREMDGARSWALIVGSEAVGFLIGSVAMSQLRPSRPILVANLSIFLWAGPIMLLALGMPAWVIAPSALVQGVGAQVFGVLWATALQEHVAPSALSRVSAYDALGSISLAPLGMAVAGPLSDAIGIDGTLWIAAAIIVGSTAAVLLVPEVRQLRSGPPVRAQSPVAVEAG
jgi:MFS family permease